MTLVGLLILLLVVGIVLAYVKVDPTIKNWIYVALALLFVIWLLFAIGVLPLRDRPFGGRDPVLIDR